MCIGFQNYCTIDIYCLVKRLPSPQLAQYLGALFPFVFIFLLQIFNITILTKKSPCILSAFQCWEYREIWRKFVRLSVLLISAYWRQKPHGGADQIQGGRIRPTGSDKRQ